MKSVSIWATSHMCSNTWPHCPGNIPIFVSCIVLWHSRNASFSIQAQLKLNFYWKHWRTRGRTSEFLDDRMTDILITFKMSEICVAESRTQENACYVWLWVMWVCVYVLSMQCQSVFELDCWLLAQQRVNNKSNSGLTRPHSVYLHSACVMSV